MTTEQIRARLLAMQAAAEEWRPALAPESVNPELVAKLCVELGHDPQLDSPDGLHWPAPVAIDEAAAALGRWIA